MSLILQINSKRGKLRIQFDAEGRQILLADIEEAIREEDHAFGVLGVQLDKPTDTDSDWQTVEFYNIVCEPDAKAPCGWTTVCPSPVAERPSPSFATS